MSCGTRQLSAVVWFRQLTPHQELYCFRLAVKPMRVFKFSAGIAIFLVAGGVFLWWAGRPPARPANMPPNAIYIETGITPFKIGTTPGTWLGCWHDPNDRADHCRLTDEKGNLKYEDTFLPYSGRGSFQQSALTFDARRTGHLWTGSHEKGIRVPVIYLTNGQILLPEAVFEEAKSKARPFIDGSAQ
jgi:hypothetical protein